MPDLQNKWTRGPKPGIVEKINDKIKPKDIFKPQIQNGIKKLQIQITKLDSTITKLKEWDSKLFKRIINVTQFHDVNASRI